MTNDDLRIEQAEDREWECLHDTVREAREDLDETPEQFKARTERYAHGKFDVTDPESRDAPHFRFLDE